MKQTAVEWLVEQLIIEMDIRIENTIIGTNLFKEAKEMEKDQMIEFAKYTSVIDTEKFDMKKVIDFYLTLDGEEFVEDKIIDDLDRK
jgi:hypothetical protein